MPSVTWIVLQVLCFNVPYVILSQVTIASLYEQGTQAYLEERFPECVEKLEQALDRYRYHRRNTQNCRLKCRYESETSEPLFSVNIEDLRFHEKNIKNTLCLIKCKIDSNGNNDNIEGQIQQIFEERRPYEYLHLCYYKINDRQKAASAAFTFLVANPNHKVMTKNLQQYSDLPEVNMKEVVNFEAQNYVYLYVYGVNAYMRKEWDTAINNIEESLVSYLHAEDKCRAQCEGPFDPGWHPDFVPAIANHFTYVLRCKRTCKKKLSSLNGEIHEDLFASHYDYLQYAYFKKGNLYAACKAVASYLLLIPDDETMLANMRFYQGMPKVQDDFFTPRDETVRYAQRDTYEERILEYIKNEFKFNQTKPDIEKKINKSFHLTTNTTDLGGQHRFILDGIASLDDCKNIMYIANSFMNVNDGYDLINETASPHTKYEKFEGVTLSRITFLTYISLLQPKYLTLILDITKEMRKTLVEKFNIKRPLYFSFTHLVCRTALPGYTKNRTDFSHKIHSDNCNLLQDNTCEKKPPAFFWRDYSAILYLNQDFEGGNFMFASDSTGNTIQSIITPQCGRMVGFSAGKENLHGVSAVTKGKRCALAVWFTMNPQYQEFDREIAQHMIKNDISFHRYFNDFIN